MEWLRNGRPGLRMRGLKTEREGRVEGGRRILKFSVIEISLFDIVNLGQDRIRGSLHTIFQ